MVIQSPPNRPEPPPDKNQMMIRAATLGVIAVVLFGVLVFRLWALQVLHSDHYVAQANQNDVRQLPLPAPRGEIEDSTGKVLVKNTSHVLAEVNPAGLATRVVCTTFPADQRAKCNAVVAATPPGAVPRCAALKGQTRCLVLARLGHVLGMKTHEVWRAYEKTLYVNADGSGGCTPKANAPCYVVNAGPPIPLKPASEPEVAYVLERRSQFPGVQFLQTTQRQYPFGELAPNVLGYVSQISQGELKDSNFAGLTGGAMVGQAGAEYSYDRELRGVDGLLEQNYDATGQRGRPDVRAARRPARRHAAADDQLAAAEDRPEGGRLRHPGRPQRRRGDGPHRGDRGHEPAERPDLCDGVLPQLQPVGVPAAGQERGQALQGHVQPAADRQDARAQGSRFHLQADHGHRGLELRRAGAGHHARLPGRLLPARRLFAHPVPELDNGQPRQHGSADRAGAVVQHLLLPAGQQDV